MDCSQLPPPQTWDLEPIKKVNEYRQHVSVCKRCRTRVLREAPDQLLFELKPEPLPEDFWIGFWPSIKSRIESAASQVEKPRVRLRLVRWAAVFVFAILLAVWSKSVIREQARPALLKAGGGAVRLHEIYAPESFQYPLIENVQNPKATYYIFQPESNEKVIMLFDPDMEL